MKIGIPAHEKDGIYGVHKDYLYFVEDLGATPVVILQEDAEEKVKKVDGLLLPGGSDINSHRYEPLLPNVWCYAPDKYLEYFDTEIVTNLIGKMPIFGICRGLQTINVILGGTLWRDIKKHPYSLSGTDLVHKVSGENIEGYVNSFHHQAIRKLAPGLEVVMESDDGFIEAIRHKTLPIFAVQWHPERLYKEGWSRSHAKKIFGL